MVALSMIRIFNDMTRVGLNPFLVLMCCFELSICFCCSIFGFSCLEFEYCHFRN